MKDQPSLMITVMMIMMMVMMLMMMNLRTCLCASHSPRVPPLFGEGSADFLHSFFLALRLLLPAGVYVNLFQNSAYAAMRPVR